MYFDPGTGSMLIQIILGAIPVIGAFFIGLRKKLFKKGDESQTKNDVVSEEVKTDDNFEDVEDD